MREESVARRYANALFDTAVEHEVVDAVAGDFDDFMELLKNSQELQAFVRSYRIPAQEKVKTFREMFDGEMNPYLLNTLTLLLKYGRGSMADLVHDHFRERMKQYKNVVTVRMVTASTLSDEVRNEVVESLEQALDANVELDEQIDESLIGGMKVKIRNTVYDGSVAHQLERMRERLK